MDVNRTLRLCIIGNIGLLVLIIAICVTFRSKEANYLNFGPNDTLVLISVKIDTWTRYYCLLGILTFVRITEVIIAEMAHPIIGFNIYNPDKKVITEFTKNALQIYGNTMYLVDNIRGIFMTLIAISQIDIALYGVVVSEMTSVYTIRLLLNEKTFTLDTYRAVSTEDEAMSQVTTCLTVSDKKSRTGTTCVL
jgi:hypothetical protein